MEKKGHPLKQIPNFPKAYAHKLAGLNITTAEEFVSLTCVDEQAKRIAEFLGLNEDQSRQLIAEVAHSLPDAIRKQMQQKPDTSQYGLGALPPKVPRAIQKK